MNGVDNAGDLPFKCIICGDDGYIRRAYGGHSLVQTSCNPIPHVFHLDCITGWFNSEDQKLKRLDERQCGECNQKKALPLIRMNGMRLLEDESPYCETQIFNACRTGKTGNLKMLLRQGRDFGQSDLPFGDHRSS